MEKSSFEREIEKHGFLVYKTKGVSMKPLLKEGRDLIIISRKPEGRLRKNDIPLVHDAQDRYVLHRIVEVRENDYVTSGDNCLSCEYGVQDDQIVGVLTEIDRAGKRLTLEDKRYRRYVHLWCDNYQRRISILRWIFRWKRFGERIKHLI